MVKVAVTEALVLGKHWLLGKNWLLSPDETEWNRWQRGCCSEKLLVTVLVASRLVLFPLFAWKTPACNHWPTISQEVVKLEKSRNWKCRRFTFKIRLYLTTGANFQRVLWKITVSVSSVRCTFHNFTTTESIWCVFVDNLMSSCKL